MLHILITFPSLLKKIILAITQTFWIEKLVVFFIYIPKIYFCFSRSYLLLIALSFHSVFEGMAIGLQHDLGALVDLFVAVIAHKTVMAFSLGLNLAQARLKFLRFAISVMIFSLASPIGMIIGMTLSNMKHTLTGDVVNRYIHCKT